MKTHTGQPSVSTRSAPAGALRRATLAGLLALTLAACGQKGPLTLTPKPRAAAGGASQAAPASVTAAARSARPAASAASAP
ncbi:MAG: lipoprotein [Betaproteobacteria bacterium]